MVLDIIAIWALIELNDEKPIGTEVSLENILGPETISAVTLHGVNNQRVGSYSQEEKRKHL